VEEPVSVDCFGCLFRVAEIAHESVAASIADLAWVIQKLPSSYASSDLDLMMVSSVPGKQRPTYR
jgi:hypothetical protein